MAIDPGMSNRTEEEQFMDVLESNDLELEYIFLTHAHLDHVMGNRFLKDRYNVPIIAHPDSKEVLKMSEPAAKMYGIPFDASPEIDEWLNVEEGFSFGETHLELRFVPGHAPGHVVIVDHEGEQVIGGDVLFDGSVGRVDLPGGDGPLLARCIQEQMYTLPDEYVVYCGHGPETTIGKEKFSNPFVTADRSIL